MGYNPLGHRDGHDWETNTHFHVGSVIFVATHTNLVPWPGMELWPPALGFQSLSHWTSREASPSSFILLLPVPLLVTSRKAVLEAQGLGHRTYLLRGRQNGVSCIFSQSSFSRLQTLPHPPSSCCFSDIFPSPLPPDLPHRMQLSQ